jgi:hypothetical protein
MTKKNEELVSAYARALDSIIRPALNAELARPNGVFSNMYRSLSERGNDWLGLVAERSPPDNGQ